MTTMDNTKSSDIDVDCNFRKYTIDWVLINYLGTKMICKRFKDYGLCISYKIQKATIQHDDNKFEVNVNDISFTPLLGYEGKFLSEKYAVDHPSQSTLIINLYTMCIEIYEGEYFKKKNPDTLELRYIDREGCIWTGCGTVNNTIKK
jgi:hypothetical protein